MAGRQVEAGAMPVGSRALLSKGAVQRRRAKKPAMSDVETRVGLAMHVVSQRPVRISALPQRTGAKSFDFIVKRVGERPIHHVVSAPNLITAVTGTFERLLSGGARLESVEVVNVRHEWGRPTNLLFSAEAMAYPDVYTVRGWAQVLPMPRAFWRGAAAR